MGSFMYVQFLSDCGLDKYDGDMRIIDLSRKPYKYRGGDVLTKLVTMMIVMMRQLEYNLLIVRLLKLSHYFLLFFEVRWEIFEGISSSERMVIVVFVFTWRVGMKSWGDITFAVDVICSVNACIVA